MDRLPSRRRLTSADFRATDVAQSWIVGARLKLTSVPCLAWSARRHTAALCRSPLDQKWQGYIPRL